MLGVKLPRNKSEGVAGSLGARNFLTALERLNAMNDNQQIDAATACRSNTGGTYRVNLYIKDEPKGAETPRRL